MKKKTSVGELVGRSVGTLAGIAMVCLSLLVSPFVWWMIAGDDEGSSWSLISIIVLIIVCAIFIGGLLLINLSNKRKNISEKERDDTISAHNQCECGAVNSVEDNYCKKCGRPLKK